MFSGRYIVISAAMVVPSAYSSEQPFPLPESRLCRSTYAMRLIVARGKRSDNPLGEGSAPQRSPACATGCELATHGTGWRMTQRSTLVCAARRDGRKLPVCRLAPPGNDAQGHARLAKEYRT